MLHFLCWGGIDPVPVSKQKVLAQGNESANLFFLCLPCSTLSSPRFHSCLIQLGGTRIVEQIPAGVLAPMSQCPSCWWKRLWFQRQVQCCWVPLGHNQPLGAPGIWGTTLWKQMLTRPQGLLSIRHRDTARVCVWGTSNTAQKPGFSELWSRIEGEGEALAGNRSVAHSRKTCTNRRGWANSARRSKALWKPFYSCCWQGQQVFQDLTGLQDLHWPQSTSPEGLLMQFCILTALRGIQHPTACPRKNHKSTTSKSKSQTQNPSREGFTSVRAFGFSPIFTIWNSLFLSSSQIL